MQSRNLVWKIGAPTTTPREESFEENEENKTIVNSSRLDHDRQEFTAFENDAEVCRLILNNKIYSTHSTITTIEKQPFLLNLIFDDTKHVVERDSGYRQEPIYIVCTDKDFYNDLVKALDESEEKEYLSKKEAKLKVTNHNVGEKGIKFLEKFQEFTGEFPEEMKNALKKWFKGIRINGMEALMNQLFPENKSYLKNTSLWAVSPKSKRKAEEVVSDEPEMRRTSPKL